MKVCFFHTRYHPHFSGHVVQLDHIRRRLLDRGFDIEVWTNRFDQSPVHDTHDGYPVRRFGPTGIGRVATMLQTVNMAATVLLDARDVDIFHCGAMENRYRWVSLAAFLTGRKQVVHMSLHGSDDPMTLLSQRWSALFLPLYRRLDRWIAITTIFRASYVKAGLPLDRLTIIPVAVDLERFKPPEDKAAVRRRLGLPVDRPIAFIVGTMCQRKGYDLVLEAVPAVAKAVPDVLFVCIGPDSFEGTIDHATFQPFADAFKADVKARSLERYFHLAGRRDDIEAWMQAGDVLLFPSRYEGSSNVTNEAAATAVPVIMSDLPGISTDLVVHGETGFVIPQEDVGALASRIVQLLTDTPLRLLMGQKARERVMELFELDRCVDQLVQVYQEVMASR